MITRTLYLFCFLCLFNLWVNAQEQEGNDDQSSLGDKIFFGGNFGFGFGDIAYLDLSPVIGYKFTSTFSGGVGAIYQYTNYRDFNVTSHTYGGRVFGIAKIRDPLFAQVEYEYLNYDFPSASGDIVRQGYSSFFVGGGIAQPISRNVSFVATALYNVTFRNASESPYESPWVIRVGFNVGF